MSRRDDEERERHAALIAGIETMRQDIVAAMAKPVERPDYPIGVQSWPRRFPAFSVALSLCVHVSDERGPDGRFVVTTLAQRFKPVPETHREGLNVRCVCEAVFVVGDLAPCPGDCGRWFVGDESGVLVVRLDDADELEAAA